jgi:arylsulfatase A-like enzyme
MFLFAHFFDVHYEYMPPPEFARFSRGMPSSIAGIPLLDPRIDASLPAEDKAYLRALYDDEIAWVDHNVGKLLGELKRMGDGRDTVVVLVSDHGDEFFEHGSKGHRRNLYQETLAVPMVMASLGWTLPRDVVVEARVRLIDVPPTLLELAGVDPPGWMMGRSLLGMARDPASALPRDAMAELQYEGVQRAFLHGSSKLIAVKEKGASAPRFELYDLERDPGETSPVSDAARLREVGAAYNRALEDLQAAATHVPSEPLAGSGPTPDLRALLETIGYTDLPAPEASLAEMLFRGKGR